MTCVLGVYFCLFLLADLDVDMAMMDGFLLAATQHGGVFSDGHARMDTGTVSIALPGPECIGVFASFLSLQVAAVHTYVHNRSAMTE